MPSSGKMVKVPDEGISLTEISILENDLLPLGIEQVRLKETDDPRLKIFGAIIMFT
jgi:hypothetical protein